MNTTASSEQRTVADVINAQMRERAMSLLELSERCGVARVTLRRHLLKGGGDISIATLSSIAQVLEVQVSDLLVGSTYDQAGAA